MKWQIIRGLVSIAVMIPGIHLIYPFGGWRLFWGIGLLMLANNISQYRPPGATPDGGEG